MDIKMYLEYQNIDGELVAIEKEVQESAEAIECFSLKKALTESTEQIKKLELESRDINNKYAKLKDSILELANSLNELTDMANEIDDIKEIEFYIKKASTVKDSLLEQSRMIQSIEKDVDRIQKIYTSTMENGGKQQKAFNEALQKFNALRDMKGESAKEIKEKLAKIAEKLSPKFIEKYNQLRSSKKLPALVVLNDNRCGRCMMDLSSDTLTVLKKEGIIECPNCGRFIYVE